MQITMDRTTSPSRRLGTFLGVFTPSVLAMLSAIMYLRFAWVVGQTGIGGTLLILLISWAIAFCTAMSASALASNMRVGVGGEYFIFSRTLGLTLGGAIGIPLLICRVLSVTLHSLALAEALAFLWPDDLGKPPLTGMTVAIVLLTAAISARSISVALKLQIPMMIAIAISIVALAYGVLTGPISMPSLAAPELPGRQGFWVVFAVFFPAVTGVVAGVGLSGDLKDPRRSIPRGILSAVAVTGALYLVVLSLLAVTDQVGLPELADISPGNSPVWMRLAFLGGFLVLPGMWGAACSSAFGGILSGPRVMQAMAKDGILPHPLQKLSPSGQPTTATWVCGTLAMLALLLGDLNAVAKIVTVFFLTFWGMLNFAAAIEALIGDPSYRPTIRTPWFVSLAGAAGCLFVMFLISPMFCVAAVSVELLIWALLRRLSLQASWGDVWTGVWGVLARFSLMKLNKQNPDPRSWRPHILLFAGDVEKRSGLVRLASAFNQDRGILTVCDLVIGRPDDDPILAPSREAMMARFFEREGLLAFGETNVVEDFEAGVVGVAQANGMGPLRSNTIMFGWPSKRPRLEALLRLTRLLYHTGKSTLIAKLCEPAGPSRHEQIDIWWRGKQKNGDLMLLLARLLSLSTSWRGATIMVRSIVPAEDQRKTREKTLDKMLYDARIPAKREVLTQRDGQPVAEIIRDASRNADVVFLGIEVPETGCESLYAERLENLFAGLPTAVLVRSAGQHASLLIS